MQHSLVRPGAVDPVGADLEVGNLVHIAGQRATPVDRGPGQVEDVVAGTARGENIAGAEHDMVVAQVA